MWSTSDEVRFINGLGNHCSPRMIVSNEDKLEYLRRYREGLELRVVWGSMEPVEVLKYVDSRIKYYDRLVHNTKPTVD